MTYYLIYKSMVKIAKYYLMETPVKNTPKTLYRSIRETKYLAANKAKLEFKSQ